MTDNLKKLVDLMATLRGPGGCPWDRKQTAESLKPFLIEECYELYQAIADEWDLVLTEAKSRTPLTESMAGADLVITSYTLLRIDAEAYAAAEWDGMILDEAQFVKNHRARTYAAARRVRCDGQLAITGTPLMPRCPAQRSDRCGPGSGPRSPSASRPAARPGLRTA